MLLLTYVPVVKAPTCGYCGYSDCDALYGGSICGPVYGS